MSRARFLAGRPDLRRRVEEDAAYRAWRATLRPVVIDGVPTFFPEGDIQKEEDDLIVDFALRRRWVSLAEVDTQGGDDDTEEDEGGR